jgi:hypothetical protein
MRLTTNKNHHGAMPMFFFFAGYEKTETLQFFCGLQITKRNREAEGSFFCVSKAAKRNRDDAGSFFL